MRGHRWSGLGSLLAAAFALAAIPAYAAYLRCQVGPCADVKGSGWALALVGLPWNLLDDYRSEIWSQLLFLGAPLLNAALLYGLGRMIQSAWFD